MAKSEVSAVTRAGQHNGLLDQYQNTWLAQARYQSAARQVERQRRLLRITKVKYERGTAEKAELLQVEAASLKARDQAAMQPSMSTMSGALWSSVWGYLRSIYKPKESI